MRSIEYGDIFNDMDGPLTRFSKFKVAAFLKSNISKAVHFMDKVTRTLIGNHSQSIEWYHIQ